MPIIGGSVDLVSTTWCVWDTLYSDTHDNILPLNYPTTRATHYHVLLLCRGEKPFKFMLLHASL